MKQTAVEWFFWKLYILKEVEFDQIMQLYEQAKEMEKEQIIEAWNTGTYAYNNGEQYYNETYERNE